MRWPWQTPKPEAREFVLADLASMPARPGERTIVFLRPRRVLTDAEWENVSDSLSYLSKGAPGVWFLLIEKHFDIMAAGESELRRLGWTKLPVESEDGA